MKLTFKWVIWALREIWVKIKDINQETAHSTSAIIIQEWDENPNLQWKCNLCPVSNQTASLILCTQSDVVKFVWCHHSIPPSDKCALQSSQPSSQKIVARVVHTNTCIYIGKKATRD